MKIKNIKHWVIRTRPNQDQLSLQIETRFRALTSQEKINLFEVLWAFRCQLDSSPICEKKSKYDINEIPKQQQGDGWQKFLRRI